MEEQWNLYIKKGETEMTPWTEQFDMTNVSISPADIESSHPKKGGMIARSLVDSTDMWYIAGGYFKENYIKK